MYRGGDVLESLHGSVPEWLLLFAALVTRLGDVWVLLSITVAVSWALTWHRSRSTAGTAQIAEADPHRSSASPLVRGPAVWPVGVVVGGLAAMTALKYFIALPRPDPVAPTPGVLPAALETTYVSTVTIGGYGFPSGHALGSTVVYGLLALTIPVGRRRVRLAAAGVVVAAISLSRVVLTVHYPGDIVAGVLVGVAYLAAAWWLLERSPFGPTSTAFALALGLGLVAVAASGAGGRSVTYAALAAGALATWAVARPRPPSRSRASSASSASSASKPTYHAESATVALGLLAGLAVAAGGLLAVAPPAALGALVVAPAVVLPRRST